MATKPTAITYTGDIPYRNQPTTFAVNAEDWTDFQSGTLIPYVQASNDYIEATAADVELRTAEALLYAQQAAAAAKYEGEWSTLTGSFQSGYSVTHNNLQWYATTDITDVTASEPSGSNPDWVDLGNLWRDTLDAALGAKYEAL